MDSITTPLTPVEIDRTAVRNDFHAYTMPPTWVNVLVDEAEQAGVYTTGIESVRRSRGPRGTSINTAVYGWDEPQHLAVIQVRQCQFRAGRFNKVRKDYYMLGRTEDGSVFAHPIESPVRSKRAMAAPEACVRWVLAQIWDCAEEDLPDIRRQGDVAFVPAHLPADAHLLIEQEITIRDTHVIRADRIYAVYTPVLRYSGRIPYAYQNEPTYYVSRRAQAVHTKGEHATVKTNGVFRVQAGIRAKVWGFTAPRGD